MGRNQRGQGAAEYLVILAVVLIVALVAIALLGAFPSIGGDARENEARQYWAVAHPFSILEYNQMNSTMTMTMKNMGLDRLTITYISMGNSTNATPISFNGGAIKSVYVYGLTPCDAVSYDYFEYNNITINYTSGHISNTYVGIKPLMGTCVVG